MIQMRVVPSGDHWCGQVLRLQQSIFPTARLDFSVCDLEKSSLDVGKMLPFRMAGQGVGQHTMILSLHWRTSPHSTFEPEVKVFNAHHKPHQGARTYTDVGLPIPPHNKPHRDIEAYRLHTAGGSDQAFCSLCI